MSTSRSGKFEDYFVIQNPMSTIILLNEMLNISFIFRYSRRFKAQEQGVLLQGIRPPAAPMAAAQSLPAPIEAPHSLQSGSVLFKTCQKSMTPALHSAFKVN